MTIFTSDRSLSPCVGLLLLLLLSNLGLSQIVRVRVGAEMLLEKHILQLQGKRIGVICNHTSVLRNGTHIVDTLRSAGITITSLFSPEHGIRGLTPAGVHVANETEAKTGLPIYSLYGQHKKPTREMVQNLDVLVFDLQDVGARFYTYYITMANAMEVAAEAHKEFVVLDRPNPINGIDIEGPILDTSLQSAIGRFPLPIRHGLTLGEMAAMAVGERWIPCDSSFKLTVIPMEGWQRSLWFDEAHFPWIAPSPNMKTLATATVYPGTCLFEATNVSEGRGTSRPFEYIGAPWIDGARLASKLNSLSLPGVQFHSITFTPHSDSSTGLSPKYTSEQCSGVFIDVLERQIFKPILSALAILVELRSAYPNRFKIDWSGFDRRLGSTEFRNELERQETAETIVRSLEVRLADFRGIRAKYIIY